MRFAAVKTIYEAGVSDPRVCFLTGDTGHLFVDEFRRSLSERYFNAGMSEQNMIGMAAGLALGGMKSFVYAIVPFTTLRCLEQIKVDVCYQNTDVTIIGVGGGFAYGAAGGTHHSIEELAALRALPNMKIICPANPMETELLMREVIKLGGPAYIRIGQGKEANPEEKYEVELGRAKVLVPGEEITLIAMGTIVSEAVRAAEILKQSGLRIEVANMHTLKPLDAEFVRDRAKNRKAIFTLEEHNVLGGLGGAVAEILSESDGPHPIFKRFGVEDKWAETFGALPYLRDQAGLSAEAVAEQIRKIWKKN